jgi:hypothetical protein
MATPSPTVASEAPSMLTWAAASAGQVPAYQARHLATATRYLSLEQAGFVDARIAPSLGAVSFGRLQTVVDAAIIEADPAGCRATRRRGSKGTVRAAGPQLSRRRWAARPNPDRQPWTPDPLPPPDQNPQRLAGLPTRTAHLAMAITPTTGSTSSTPLAPIPSATPNSPRQSGTPPQILPRPS